MNVGIHRKEPKCMSTCSRSSEGMEETRGKESFGSTIKTRVLIFPRIEKAWVVIGHVFTEIEGYPVGKSRKASAFKTQAFLW